MGLVERVQRWIRRGEPTLVDYETYEQQLAAGGPAGMHPPTPTTPQPEMRSGAEPGFAIGGGNVLGRIGLGFGNGGGAGGGSGNTPMGASPAGNYKIQQSYDALLQTVQDLRAALDGQSRRQEELFDRLSTLPHAAEALPQTTKMQSDMLKLINDRLAMHADQQRKVSEVVTALGGGEKVAGAAKKEYAEALQSIREQIEMGNEIDRQLVESFNRFSMMIDRLQLANQHAVDALQQVRDSYAASAMQMHEWIEKSRHRSGWLIGGAFLLALISLIISLVMMMQAAGR
jgi:hypothetical protein